MRELPKIPPIEFDGYSLDVDYYLKRPYEDISEAAEELPAIIEWVGSVLQAVYEDKLVSRQKIKEVEAMAYTDAAAEADTTARKTDAYLTRRVSSDNRVREAHAAYAKFAAWTQRLDGLQKSLMAKLDLTRSAESTRRNLIDNTPDPE